MTLSIDQYIEVLRTASEPVIVFTTGGAGRNAYAALDNCGIDIFCFADNDSAKFGDVIDICRKRVKVISFEELRRVHPNAHVVIPPKRWVQEIVAQFLRAGHDKERLCVINFEVLEHAGSLEKCDRIRSLFEDERSTEIFDERVSYLRSGDISTLGKVRDDGPIYFEPDIIRLRDNEIVIDGGGHTGDTFREYIRIMPKFEKYYLCEPDERYMQTARKIKPPPG